MDSLYYGHNHEDLIAYIVSSSAYIYRLILYIFRFRYPAEFILFMRSLERCGERCG